MWGVELGYGVRAVGFGVGLNSLGSVCRVRGCRAKGLELGFRVKALRFEKL